MTEEERRALPWYGGNKIPESYLKKFSTSQGEEADPDLPYELRLFLHNMGEKPCKNTLHSDCSPS